MLQGIAEGMSIKLGEMIDQPRHQRIAKLAKEEEERKQSNHNQQKSLKEVLSDCSLHAICTRQPNFFGRRSRLESSMSKSSKR